MLFFGQRSREIPTGSPVPNAPEWDRIFIAEQHSFIPVNGRRTRQAKPTKGAEHGPIIVLRERLGEWRTMQFPINLATVQVLIQFNILRLPMSCAAN